MAFLEKTGIGGFFWEEEVLSIGQILTTSQDVN